MNEPKLKDLLDSLFSLEYDWNSGSSHYKSKVVNKEGRIVVEQMIREFLLDNRDEKIGILEAKVFTYEEMISKSTFAPMLKSKEVVVVEKTEKEIELETEVEKLNDFKNYVHFRLDDAGIEKYPNGIHSEHGCRIGDRLDIVLKASAENKAKAETGQIETD